MKDHFFRVDEFKRNDTLENLLKELNGALSIAEKSFLSQSNQKDFPMIFIIGPHRSGTTLLLQWLANTKQFAYPTNLLSRFYEAPIIGAKIQQLLTDEKYNFRNELFDLNSEINYKSKNGKTQGSLSPNEFWYFWRRFLNFKELDYLPNNLLMDTVDVNTLKSELLGLANVFEKPFALKAMICNYNIEFLNNIFEHALFIYVKRDPYTNIESALKARERQSGDMSQWYSFKIPEYHKLLEISDPIEQTAGQIYFINKAIATGLEHVNEDKKIVVSYEKFCENPEIYYSSIHKKLKAQGFKVSEDYIGPKSFEVTRSGLVADEIKAAYKKFERN